MTDRQGQRRPVSTITYDCSTTTGYVSATYGPFARPAIAGSAVPSPAAASSCGVVPSSAGGGVAAWSKLAHHQRARLDRDVVAADPDGARIEPGLARAQVELPAVPRAADDLVAARNLVLAGPRRRHQPGLTTVAQRAALVRAAVSTAKYSPPTLNTPDGAAADLDDLPLAGRDIVHSSDDVAGHSGRSPPGSR